MDWGVFATVFSAITGALSFGYSVLQGKSLSRRFFKSGLLYHSVVKQEYESLKEETLTYSRGRNMRDWLLVVSVIVNIFLFTTIIWDESLARENKEAAAFLFFAVVVWWVLLNLLFIFLKKTLISEVQLERNDVKGALNGSAWMFLASVLAFIIIVSLKSSAVGSLGVFYSFSVVVAGIGAILSAVMFSSIIDIGTALLWKIYVSDSNEALADKLPHLLVKTRTGGIFFGQLYDPLDNKLLLLRKAKLVIYGGQDLIEMLGEIVSSEVTPGMQENYLSIPWDEIETLQIVERGLYGTPRNNHKTKNNVAKKDASGRV
jgi:hypothetical protein